MRCSICIPLEKSAETNYYEGMELFREVVIALFAADSIWSVVLRGAVWLGISLVIIISTDAPNPEASLKGLKSNLGFFLMFLVLSGTLIGMLFSFTKA